jgi:hypothetical protein
MFNNAECVVLNRLTPGPHGRIRVGAGVWTSPDFKATTEGITMTICTDEVDAHSDETYWVDDNAAQPVLLIDEATNAITEALHRLRSGSMLDDRDLAAAGVALGDLFGGLGQLAALLTTSVDKYTGPDAIQAGQLEDRLETLRAMTLSARQVATGLLLRTELRDRQGPTPTTRLGSVPCSATRSSNGQAQANTASYTYAGIPLE